MVYGGGLLVGFSPAAAGSLVRPKGARGSAFRALMVGGLGRRVHTTATPAEPADGGYRVAVALAGCRAQRRVRGSIRSRRPSPSRLQPRTVHTMASPGTSAG